MRARRSPALAVAAVSLAVACGPAAPSSPRSVAGERAAVAEANALERELERLGLVAAAPRALRTYLQSVGDRVARGRGMGSLRPRFAVLDDPSPNARALPNGAIYVHSGLLARLENEAQLAQVLAHELSHVARRHRKDSEERTPEARPSLATTRAADAAMTASLGAAVSAPSALRPRRRAAAERAIDQEREADRDALRAIAAAGYATSEASRLYVLLGDEATSHPFGSHPAAAERAGDARSAAGAGGALHAEAYLQATREIAVRNVRLCLEQRLYRRAIEEVERSRRLRGHDPRLDALEAEARRELAARLPERPVGAARPPVDPYAFPETPSDDRFAAPDADRRAALAALPANALR